MIVSIALPVVCIVAIGSLLPQQHIASRSASFRASRERLFSLIAGAQSWRADVLHEEAVPDWEGREFRRETSRNGDTITYEILDRLPPKSLTRRIATKNLPYSGSWTFSLRSDGESTIVRITETGEVNNPVFRFVSRFVLGHNRTLDAYLRELGLAMGQQIAVRE